VVDAPARFNRWKPLIEDPVDWPAAFAEKRAPRWAAP
jgi:hypothetical protein